MDYLHKDQMQLDNYHRNILTRDDFFNGCGLWNGRALRVPFVSKTSEIYRSLIAQADWFAILNYACTMI